MEHSAVEKAYLAGFVDGDGAIMLHTSGKAYIDVLLSISNTDFAVLKALKELWGGNLLVDKVYNPLHKPRARLRFSCRAAVVVLQQLEPYLKVKREPCRIALQFADTINPHYRATGVPPQILDLRRNLQKELKKLNRRGVYTAISIPMGKEAKT